VSSAGEPVLFIGCREGDPHWRPIPGSERRPCAECQAPTMFSPAMLARVAEHQSVRFACLECAAGRRLLDDVVLFPPDGAQIRELREAGYDDESWPLREQVGQEDPASMSRTKLKPKRLRDYPKVYRDALACFEALRRLGFDADEIFFGFDMVDEAPDMVHMQLQTQGKKFTVTVAQLPGASRHKVARTWKTLAKLMNELPPRSPEWYEHVWNQHLLGSSLEYFAMFTAGIQAKGIIVPELAPLVSQGQA